MWYGCFLRFIKNTHDMSFEFFISFIYCNVGHFKIIKEVTEINR